MSSFDVAVKTMPQLHGQETLGRKKISRQARVALMILYFAVLTVSVTRKNIARSTHDFPTNDCSEQLTCIAEAFSRMTSSPVRTIYPMFLYTILTGIRPFNFFVAN